MILTERGPGLDSATRPYLLSLLLLLSDLISFNALNIWDERLNEPLIWILLQNCL